MSVALDINVLEMRLEKLRNQANMVDVSPDKFPVDAMKNHVKAIAAAIDALAADLEAPKSSYPIKSGGERHASAVTAIAAWARDVGAAIVRPDSAMAAIHKHCQDSHRGFWAAQHPNLILGLVGQEMKTSELLKAEGVLIFLADPDDNYIRIVDTKQPSAHADILRRVTEWAGGNRCRMCRIEEPALSTELQPVEAEHRNGLHTINGVVQMQAGIVHTHPQCRPYWLKWLAIAGHYPDLADAEAADRAHGRAPHPAPPPKPQWEPTRADQETKPIKRNVSVNDGRG